MITDEDFPIAFTGKAYNLATLSLIKKHFVVPINKKDLNPAHKNAM